MYYRSFDLRLGEWNPTTRTGVAEVLNSPAGEGQRYSFLLPAKILSPSEEVLSIPSMAKELGQRLAASVFSPESWTLWNESYQIVRERKQGLRLRLHIDSWELARVPWELLYDARRAEFFVFDPLVSVVRYVRLHAVPPSLRQAHSLKVMAVVATPTDQAQLAWDEELERLHKALQELIDSDRLELSVCEHATYDKLHFALMETLPDVVHYIGHALYDPERHEGSLLLEDEHGLSAQVGANEIARLLRRYLTSLVVLNACETAKGAWAGLAPALVRAELPAVVAMQWPVEDRAAIHFSRAFYRALSLRKTIDECVAEGRIGANAIDPSPQSWAAPVLFLRSSSGELWTEEMPGPRKRPKPVSAPPQKTVPPASEEEFFFKTRGPLQPSIDEELLIDRPELRRALRIARQPSVTQYVAFLGARQTGKTTLLFRLMDLLQDMYVCVFIDLSVLRQQDARACFRYVAFRLLSELRDILGDDLHLAEPPQIESAVDFLEFLRQLAEAVPLPRIIILIDEVGALSPEASDSFFNTLRTVFTQGRSMNGQLAKYLFIFSGAVDLYSLTFGTNSPLNICEKLYLQDFTRQDVAKIVNQFKRLGIPVDEEAIDKVYELTHGHPYLTMRLCALMEQARVAKVTPAEVERMADQMLIEDDNIRHVIRELERNPSARRRLRSILIEGQQIPFSRNDPILASLEMIGAIQASQPCQVRNLLYERALRWYYAQLEGKVPQPSTVQEKPLSEDVELTYGQLESLHAQALDETNHYQPGKAWESFAAALFSMIPAFSLYPTTEEVCSILLSIDPSAPGGDYWAPYQPAILVTCHNLPSGSPEEALSNFLHLAERYQAKLTFIMLAGEPSKEENADTYSGLYGETCLVALEDSELIKLLKERAELEPWLKEKVLQARLRKA
ncbi:MAG: CHAT domain-containing protein [Anaerolineae bacterium]|nr:CHAT domain-containing protein [Anaerolineae bacterium]